MLNYRGKDVKLKLISNESSYKIILTEIFTGRKETYCTLTNRNQAMREFDALVKMDMNGEFKPQDIM